MRQPRDIALHRTIGARLQEIRRTRGLTQEQFAEAVGIQPPTLSRYETGRRSMSVDLLVRVAGALDVPVDRLLQGHACRSSVLDEDESVATLKERWLALGEKERELVLELLASLAKPSTGYPSATSMGRPESRKVRGQ